MTEKQRIGGRYVRASRSEQPKRIEPGAETGKPEPSPAPEKTADDTKSSKPAKRS